MGLTQKIAPLQQHRILLMLVGHDHDPHTESRTQSHKIRISETKVHVSDPECTALLLAILKSCQRM